MVQQSFFLMPDAISGGAAQQQGLELAALQRGGNGVGHQGEVGHH